MNSELSADAFFSAIKHELPKDVVDNIRSGTWSEDYHSDTVWTREAVKAICRACGRFADHVWAHAAHLPEHGEANVQFHRGEYLNLDVSAYNRETDDSGNELNNWRLRIVVEHENSDGWPEELCKLKDIVADLRVLVCYMQIDQQDDARAALNKATVRLKDCINRVPDSQWIFIVGPWQTSQCKEFLGYTLNADGEVIAI